MCRDNYSAVSEVTEASMVSEAGPLMDHENAIQFTFAFCSTKQGQGAIYKVTFSWPDPPGSEVTLPWTEKLLSI
jgi:hypothetical protein